MSPNRSQCHLGWYTFILAPELKIFFRLHGVFDWFIFIRRCRFDTFGDIGEDLARAEHTVRIESIVAVP